MPAVSQHLPHELQFFTWPGRGLFCWRWREARFRDRQLGNGSVFGHVIANRAGVPDQYEEQAVRIGIDLTDRQGNGLGRRRFERRAVTIDVRSTKTMLLKKGEHTRKRGGRFQPRRELPQNQGTSGRDSLVVQAPVIAEARSRTLMARSMASTVLLVSVNDRIVTAPGWVRWSRTDRAV